MSLRGHTLLAAPLGDPLLVYDLGANRGEFSRQLRAIHPGTFHLIEANPTLAESLHRDEDWIVTHAAVGGETGEVTLNIARNDECSSTLTLPEESTYDSRLETSVTVPQVALEEIFAQNDGVIDVAKMDIEGSEIASLSSLSSATLERVAQFTVEFHSAPAFGFDIAQDTKTVLSRFRDEGFLVLDFSFGRRMDVLLLNERVLGMTKAQRHRLEAEKALSAPMRFVRAASGVPGRLWEKRRAAA